MQLPTRQEATLSALQNNNKTGHLMTAPPGALVLEPPPPLLPIEPIEPIKPLMPTTTSARPPKTFKKIKGRWKLLPALFDYITEETKRHPNMRDRCVTWIEESGRVGEAFWILDRKRFAQDILEFTASFQSLTLTLHKRGFVRKSHHLINHPKLFTLQAPKPLPEGGMAPPKEKVVRVIEWTHPLFQQNKREQLFQIKLCDEETSASSSSSSSSSNILSRKRKRKQIASFQVANMALTTQHQQQLQPQNCLVPLPPPLPHQLIPNFMTTPHFAAFPAPPSILPMPLVTSAPHKTIPLPINALPPAIPKCFQEIQKDFRLTTDKPLPGFQEIQPISVQRQTIPFNPKMLPIHQRLDNLNVLAVPRQNNPQEQHHQETHQRAAYAQLVVSNPSMETLK